MPSALAHVAPALALIPAFARPGVPRRLWWLGVIGAIAPDLDVIAFALGVPYSHPLGHRGLWHSVPFAALAAGCVAVLAFPRPLPGGSRSRAWLYLFCATASHGLLDAATDGGLGVALLAPFSEQPLLLPVPAHRRVAARYLGLLHGARARGDRERAALGVAALRGARPPALAARAMSKLLKYARIERERRFLLAALPAGIDPATGYQQLDDLYLEGTRLRLRSVTSPTGTLIEQKLNQKLLAPSGDAAHRIITSVYLDPAEYAALAALPGRRLQKRRYTYAHEGHAVGIDVFRGPLAGLVLAEIELDLEAELRALPLPGFAHSEITELALFTGSERVRAPERALRDARRRPGG